MSFSNSSLSIEQIPALKDMETQALSEKYRPTNIFFNVILFTSLMLIVTAICFQPFFSPPEKLLRIYPYLMAILGTLGVLLPLYHFFADPIKRYALREQDLSFTSGLVFRKTVCQPILRIQHIEVKRGPIERMFGMASLQVFSAGGAMHTFEIPGLEADVAQQLRQFILDHKDVKQHG